MAYYKVSTLLQRWKSALKKAKTPRIYETEEVEADDKKVTVKFFWPAGRWTWYVAEWDGEDECFGYVKSGLGEDCDEWGYFRLSELATLNLGLSDWRRCLQVERDLYFKPQTFKEVQVTD